MGLFAAGGFAVAIRAVGSLDRVWTPGLSLCPKQVEKGRVERALPFLLCCLVLPFPQSCVSQL